MSPPAPCTEAPAIDADLRELESIAHVAALPQLAGEIHRASESLARGELTIVVLGQFKRGKSSLLNAIAGRELFPTGVLPMTAVATALVRGEEGATVLEAGGSSRTIPLSHVSEYVSEKRNAGNRRGVTRVVIAAPLPDWAEGITFVDSPGIGSPHDANTRAARELLPSADAAIFVLSPDPSVTADEIAFLSEASSHAAKFFFVLNKVDLLSPDNRAELLQYLDEILRERCGFASARIYPTSARDALAGGGVRTPAAWARSGLQALWDDLHRFVGPGRVESLRAVARARTRQFGARLRGTIELALRTSSLSEQEYDEKLMALEQGIAEIRSEHRATQALLNEEIERLCQGLPGRLRQLTGGEAPSIVHALEAGLGSIPAGFGSTFVREFDRRLRERLGPVITHLRDTLTREATASLEQMASQFERRLGRWTREMSELVRQEFGVQMDPIAFATELAHARHYTDHIEGRYDGTLAGQTVLFLPAGLVRQRIRTQLSTLVADELDAQSGRIRADLVERIHRSWHALKEQVAQQLEQNLREIELALQQGRAQHAGDQVRRERWRADMERWHERVEAIERRANAAPGLGETVRPSPPSASVGPG